MYNKEIIKQLRIGFSSIIQNLNLEEKQLRELLEQENITKDDYRLIDMALCLLNELNR